jgi:hypothetical protein
MRALKANARSVLAFSLAAPKLMGLKSYLRLSVLLLKSFLITLSDASTHFRPGEKVAERFNLR